MKIKDFFIQQPFATMLARGLRNAVFDDHFSKGDRLFIYALPCFYMSNTPLEWFQAVNNHQLFGKLLQDITDLLATASSDTERKILDDWKHRVR